VAGLWRKVSGSRRRVSAERGRRQGNGHGGRLLQLQLQLLLVHLRRLHGESGVLVHEMLEHGCYQSRTGRQLSGKLIEGFAFLTLQVQNILY